MKVANRLKKNKTKNEKRLIGFLFNPFNNKQLDIKPIIERTN